MCLTSWVQLIGEDSVEEGTEQGIVGGVVIKGIGRCGSGSVTWELTEVKFKMEGGINGSQGEVTDGKAAYSSVACQTETAGSLSLLPLSSTECKITWLLVGQEVTALKHTTKLTNGTTFTLF